MTFSTWSNFPVVHSRQHEKRKTKNWNVLLDPDSEELCPPGLDDVHTQTFFLVGDYLLEAPRWSSWYAWWWPEWLSDQTVQKVLSSEHSILSIWHTTPSVIIIIIVIVLIIIHQDGQGPKKNTYIKVSLVQSILIQQLLFSLFSLTERPKSCYRRNDNNYFGTEPSSLQKICQEGGWS